MARRLPKLEHVKYVRSRGRLYAYFNTGQKKDGKPIYLRMPDPSAPGFFDSYASFKAGRTRRIQRAATVASLIDQYLTSREYLGKAINTQRLYAIQLDKAAGLLGECPVNDLLPSDVRDAIEVGGWAAGTQNAFVAAIGALYTWARKRGKAEIEPVKDIGRVKGGQHQPWPDDVLEAALACDNPRVRLAVHLLYFTGQRIGDVCKLRWSDIRRGEFRIRQEKTGKLLHIQIAAELQAELDRTQRAGLFILTGTAGAKAHVSRIRDELQAFTAWLGVKTVPHGLRKNAVNALLMAGCTIAEVAAITGQTYAVVEHYAAQVDNRRLGQAAMLKFESSRRGTRPERENALENSKKNAG